MYKKTVHYCTECHGGAIRYCFREHPHFIVDYQINTVDLEWPILPQHEGRKVDACQIAGCHAERVHGKVVCEEHIALFDNIAGMESAGNKCFLAESPL